MSLPLSGVPTTIITGFLGTEKTTLLLDAFRHRPDGEASVLDLLPQPGLGDALSPRVP